MVKFVAIYKVMLLIIYPDKIKLSRSFKPAKKASDIADRGVVRCFNLEDIIDVNHTGFIPGFNAYHSPFRQVDA